MKWITLIIGIAIIAGGVWFLMKPNSADGPTVDDAMMEETNHEGVMEDGTMDMDMDMPAMEGEGGEMMMEGDAMDSEVNKTQ